MSIIKSARTHLQLSQSQMATWIRDRTGRPCTPSQVSDWENGRKQPRQHVRDAVADPAGREVWSSITGAVPVSKARIKILTEMMR